MVRVTFGLRCSSRRALLLCLLHRTERQASSSIFSSSSRSGASLSSGATVRSSLPWWWSCLMAVRRSEAGVVVSFLFAARAWDSDAEFLLIEAAFTLPWWLDLLDAEDDERQRGLPTAAGDGGTKRRRSSTARRNWSASARSPPPSNNIDSSTPAPAKAESHRITTHSATSSSVANPSMAGSWVDSWPPPRSLLPLPRSEAESSSRWSYGREFIELELR